MKTIREELEELEYKILSPIATKSRETRGRQKEEPPCPIRPAFQHDRDRILHSKSFRRLKYKTQVLLLPKGDHYRTRLTHTLEVSQIARTISKALRLNEDLTEAIALGHDLGHTPFGHAGEAVINSLKPGGFRHAEQSLRVVDILEKKGEGLNLTYEVRDGIRKHSKGKGPIIPVQEKDKPLTPEGIVVRIADIIAYLNHDFDDAIRAEVLKEDDLPADIKKKLGEGYSKRIDAMVKDVIYTTMERGDVGLSEEMEFIMERFRDFLFERVYESPLMKTEFKKCFHILEALYEYYIKNPHQFMKDAEKTEDEIESEGIEVMVCDFIAGMTDRYALRKYEEIFIPRPWIG